MSTNPPNLRPDLANAKITESRSAKQPIIGMVSLGCPKALVDSERILTRLRAEGYGVSPDYSGADAVIVNTCGFLDSAKAESLEAISEALNENGRVIVTGCLGAEPEYITGYHPKVLAVTGPHQYEQVLDAVHAAVPPNPDPFVDSLYRCVHQLLLLLQLLPYYHILLLPTDITFYYDNLSRRRHWHY